MVKLRFVQPNMASEGVYATSLREENDVDGVAGRRRIIIFAISRIVKDEELTYLIANLTSKII